jgi:protein-S-isoprenylcysteine O-methyltransferase Ste14
MTGIGPSQPAAGSGALLIPVLTLVCGSLIFALAGTLAWPAAWAYLAVATVSMVAYSIILQRLHPDLIDERRKPPADAKKWDRPFVALIGAIGPLVLLTVCGLDHRFGWSGPMAGWVPWLGVLLVAAGHILANWAVAANRFFSALVRIQRDRGHVVIDRGPYALVRHPGYLGSVLHMIGTCVALTSWWGMAVVALVMALLIVRTGLEDRTLRDELEGYAAYAARVRWRLIPGVW